MSDEFIGVVHPGWFTETVDLIADGSEGGWLDVLKIKEPCDLWVNAWFNGDFERGQA